MGSRRVTKRLSGEQVRAKVSHVEHPAPGGVVVPGPNLCPKPKFPTSPKVNPPSPSKWIPAAPRTPTSRSGRANIPPRRSTNWRAWPACGNGRGCISGRRTSGGCTTACSRSWTTLLTNTSRHPRGHAPAVQDPGHRVGADQPARGRQVRPGRLQILRRPARRRRQVRQRPLRLVQGRGLPRRAHLPHGLRAGRDHAEAHRDRRGS